MEQRVKGPDLEKKATERPESKKGRFNNTEEKELPSQQGQQGEGMRQNESEVEVVEIKQELSRMTKRNA